MLSCPLNLALWTRFRISGPTRRLGYVPIYYGTRVSEGAPSARADSFGSETGMMGTLRFAHPTTLLLGPRPPYIRAMANDKYLIKPDPLDPRLTERVTGVDQTGAKVETSVVVECALTISSSIRRRSLPR